MGVKVDRELDRRFLWFEAYERAKPASVTFHHRLVSRTSRVTLGPPEPSTFPLNRTWELLKTVKLWFLLTGKRKGHQIIYGPLFGEASI